MHALELGVNIDHVATLRQARHTRYPEPLAAALAAAAGGADSITVHLREDRRHIQEQDVWALQESLAVPLNLEMAVTEPMLALAEKIRPRYCCLVPERRAELTTEGGLDVTGQRARLGNACTRLAAAGMRVALFIDPDPAQVDASLQCGAPVIELHTGTYADAPDAGRRARELERVRSAAELGARCGLHVNAGHGLNYENTAAIAALTMLRELNIGHGIVARAVFVGMEQAVREMRALMQAARAP